jgi:hypothetical protein
MQKGKMDKTEVTQIYDLYSYMSMYSSK